MICYNFRKDDKVKIIELIKNLTFNPQKVVKKVNRKNYALRFVIFLLGIFFCALAFNVFFAPQDIVMPGISGIAVLVSHASGMPASTFIFFANIFLIGLSLIVLGGEKSINNIIGSLAYSGFVVLTQNINNLINVSFENELLYVLCGAVLFGLGCGIVFRVGFSTGGADILGLIISKYTQKPIGKSMLVVNTIIILIGGYTFGYTMMLYAIIIAYISTLLMDKIVLGISDSKMFMIDTQKQEEVTKFIIEVIGSGVTIFKARGGYKEDKKEIIMCVVSTANYFQLKQSVKEIDSGAFIMVNDCYEVYGGTKKQVIPF